MTQPDRRNEKKAFIEIKVLRMETINPSFSDGSGVFWERVITTLLLIIDQKALKNKVIADALISEHSWHGSDGQYW